MGSFSEPMEFNPATGRLEVESNSELSVSPRDDFPRGGGKLEFNPGTSDLVLEGTTPVQPGIPSKCEEFKFDPSSARLVPQKSIEKELRQPTANTTYRFDKTKGGLTTTRTSHENQSRKCTKTKSSRPVAVDMNRRGTGGFF